MNEHFPLVVEMVKSSPKLLDEEKSEIINAINGLEKERYIASFKFERTDKIRRTIAILLEETIAELEENRNAVEEQKHELRIEVALEAVRLCSLAMQKTEDIKDVVDVVFKKLQELNVLMDGGAVIITRIEHSKDL